MAMKERPKKKKAASKPATGVKSMYEINNNDQYLIRERGIKSPAKTSGNRK